MAPSPAEAQFQEAETLSTEGEQLYAAGQDAEAAVKHRRALELYETALAATAPHPMLRGKRAWQRLLLADALDHDADSEADGLYAEAIEETEAILGEGFDAGLAQHTLMRSHGGRGAVARRAGHLKQALKSYQKALKHAEKLAELGRTQGEWQQNPASYLLDIGDVLEQMGNAARTSEARRRAVALLESVTEKHPAPYEPWRLLGTARRQLGESEGSEKNLEAAVIHFRAGLSALDEVIQRGDTTGYTAWNYVHLARHLARALSLLEQEDEAKRAMVQGYLHLVHLKRSDALVPSLRPLYDEYLSWGFPEAKS